MGLLDDAIREHLELKRRHGASSEEVDRQEREALGGTRSAEPEDEAPEAPAAPFDAATEEPEPASEPLDAAAEEPAPADEPDAAAEDPWLEAERDEVPADETLDRPPPAADDVLEETPDFLQETPEHERLWFEQRPPRDFDWDK